MGALGIAYRFDVIIRLEAWIETVYAAVHIKLAQALYTFSPLLTTMAPCHPEE